MRKDAVGLFWQDAPGTKRDWIAPIMPPIPDTGYTLPELPNLSRARALSIDVETYDPELRKFGPGWARGKGHIVGLAVGTEDGGRWYLPMRHTIRPEENLDPEHVLAWARDTLGDPTQPKIGANLAYDVGWLQEEGVEVAGTLYDVQFAEALLSEASQVNLDTLAHKYLGVGKTTNALYEWCAQYYGGSPSHDQRSNIYRAPACLVAPYAASDVDLPFRILERQWGELATQGLLDVFELECRLIPLFIAMRFQGVHVDLERAERLQKRLRKEADEKQHELDQLAGFAVNVNSGASVAKVFDRFKLRYERTAEGAPSFTSAFLAGVEHPVGELVRTIRAREKLNNTFIQSYLLDAHVDGKLYGQFHQLRSDGSGTRSGRLSSSTPNLQNIPSRSALGKEIRKCFIPSPGKRWVKADYSQIEYRILAHYAVGPESDTVRRAYNEDPTTDFHTMVGKLIEQTVGLVVARDRVKNVNFGVTYGMGERTMASTLNLPSDAAAELLKTIHGAAPFLSSTMDATMEEAAKLGYITTVLGRRSRFDLWVPSAFSLNYPPLPFERAVLEYPHPKRAYLHKALNRRLQGSAADLLKKAMLRCWEEGLFQRTGVPMLTVHDELDFEDAGGLEDDFRKIKTVMETAIPFRVPVRAEWEIGPNWGEVEEWEL